MYLKKINQSIRKNHAYEAGLVSKAYLKRNVIIAKRDLVIPQPGHGNPVSSMHGQEALKRFNVKK